MSNRLKRPQPSEEERLAELARAVHEGIQDYRGLLKETQAAVAKAQHLLNQAVAIAEHKVDAHGEALANRVKDKFDATLKAHVESLEEHLEGEQNDLNKYINVVKDYLKSFLGVSTRDVLLARLISTRVIDPEVLLAAVAVDDAELRRVVSGWLEGKR